MMLRGTSQSRGHGTGQGTGRCGGEGSGRAEFLPGDACDCPATVAKAKIWKILGEGGKLSSHCLHTGTQCDWETQAAPTDGEQDSLWVQSRAFPRTEFPQPVQGGGADAVSSQDSAVISHGARAVLTFNPQGLETSGLGSRLQQSVKLCLKRQEHTGPLCKASGRARWSRHRAGGDLCFSSVGRGTARTTDPTFPDTWVSHTTVSPTGHLIQTIPPSLPHGTPVPHSAQQVTVTVQWSSCPHSRSYR